MTASRPDTWMPMYWGDYLKDTGHLSTEQHGAYILLIGHYWTTGKPLPDDDGRLARIARLSLATWKKSRQILAEFFTVADSKWTHGRIEKELVDAETFLEKQRSNGQKGGRPKKPNDNPPHNPSTIPEKTTSPSPSPDRTENYAQPSSLNAARAEDLKKAKEEVEKLLNSPSVTMFNRVDAWLAAGAILESDILPAIRAGLAKLNGSAVRSLAYFDGFVADAIAARTKPLPAGGAKFTAAPRAERGAYAPSAPPSEVSKMNRLEGYARAIKQKRNPGLHCTQIDIREMLKLELVTLADLDACSLAA